MAAVGNSAMRPRCRAIRSLKSAQAVRPRTATGSSARSPFMGSPSLEARSTRRPRPAPHRAPAAPGRSVRVAGLHFHEQDAAQRALIEAIEHHEVHRTAEEAGILGVKAEAGEERQELLGDPASDHGLTAEDRILADRAGVPPLPGEEADQRHEQADHHAAQEVHELLGAPTPYRSRKMATWCRSWPAIT